jgi:hypothetical protein
MLLLLFLSSNMCFWTNFDPDFSIAMICKVTACFMLRNTRLFPDTVYITKLRVEQAHKNAMSLSWRLELEYNSFNVFPYPLDVGST